MQAPFASLFLNRDQFLETLGHSCVKSLQGGGVSCAKTQHCPPLLWQK